MKEEIYYKIWDTFNQEYVHAMTGIGNTTQDKFYSVESARNFNCHGLFEDKVRYEIHKFIATTDEINVDPCTKAELIKYKIDEHKKEQQNIKYSKFLKENYGVNSENELAITDIINSRFLFIAKQLEDMNL